MIALDIVYLFPGFPIMLEVFLTGVLIALIGAAGYTFFIYSMKDDRAEKIAQRYRNPWDRVSGEDANTKPQHPRISKSTLIGIALLVAASIVLVLLIMLVAKN